VRLTESELKKYTQRELSIAQEIAAMTADYWNDVDCNWGATAHEFFTEDGVFHVDDHEFKGRAGVRDFYGWRKGRGARVARHLVNNLQIDVRDDHHANTTWVLCLYAADGEAPLPSRPPIMIADVHEQCVREADGFWRYKHRRMKAVFVGDTPVTVPAKKP
jgi:hypothetical protein